MRKVIAAMNMTLDGICDHTVMYADDEIHQHYNDLLSNADTLIYGRITYQLMESYWPDVIQSPTGNQPTDNFAILIDKIPKVVFSHTLEDLNWRTARLAKRSIAEEILELKQHPGKDILIGSPSLIVAAMNLKLVDEYQISVHPIVVGKGLLLFDNVIKPINLKLLKTKTFSCGAITFYYMPDKN